jgi:hypothetical protein
MTGRSLEERWARPEYEVLCEMGFAHGALQIARLEHRGRAIWKTRRTAERHAREFTEKHGHVAYVSEV